ncbi:MAG: MliC family protein, partial [Pseudomonadota bacterium]
MTDWNIIPANFLHWCASALTAAALGACDFAPAPLATPGREPGTPNTTTLVYECTGGYRFTARIRADGAQLLLPNTTLALPQVRSGSGARYSKNGVTFWSKGEEALLETAATTYRDCRINR